MKLFFNVRVQRNGGQIALGTAIFFLMISSTIVLGVAAPVYKEVKNVNQFRGTRESYYLSEALNEDLTYRVKNARMIPASPTLVLNGNTATGTVSAIGGDREIITTGDRQDSLRRIRTLLIQSPTGVSFNYGTQSGNGGFSLGNNAGVVGNVYANGSVSGSNGSYITGTVVAANSLVLVTDQDNSSPSTPPNSIVFGNANGTQDIAQSFQSATTSPLNKIQLYIKKTSTPSNATVNIVTDSGGAPSSNVLSTGTLSASSVTTSYGWVDVTVSPNIELTEGETYWIIVDASTNSTRYYTVGANSAYTFGTAKIGQYESTWDNTSPSGLDAYFKLYLGGLTATISGVTIGTGTTGDAWAHTVDDSTVRGSLYCQTGSGNNKSCDTSRPDPTPTALPISDDLIASWKSDAALNTIYGNYTVSGASTLGPQTITGDLTIDGILTLSGTLYVQGNILLSNGASVNLSSSFGSESGVLVTDGRVTISNNATFAGSGQAGSYMLVVTTSDCPISASCGGSNAIDVSNNAGTVILNAQKGTVHVSNNAGAKEITAYRVELDNNSTVTYESGLANVNFTSGPGGGYDIGSWQEIR